MGEPMSYQLLDVVRAAIDVPDQAIRAGDLGTVVEVHGQDAYEIEFCNDRGETLAMFAMSAAELCPARLQKQVA